MGTRPYVAVTVGEEFSVRCFRLVYGSCAGATVDGDVIAALPPSPSLPSWASFTHMGSEEASFHALLDPGEDGT